MKPGRQVVDWPREDLEAVLKKEGVEKFMIMGHSQGTAHAMAAAYYFQERCEGFGLNAPLLPTKVSKEEDIITAIGSDSLPNTASSKILHAMVFFNNAFNVS